MISRKFYSNLLARISLIVIFSLLLGYTVFEKGSVRLSLICIIIILITTISLVVFLNSTNRKIKFFFDSVRNDDSSLTFSGSIRDGSFAGLYESLDRVNNQIRQLKIDNRNQEQYFQILLEHLATGIITYDDKGFINHVNTAARKLLSAEVLTHISQIERIDRRLYQVINGLKPFDRRLVSISSPQGETELSLKATSFRIRDSEHVILSIQDIKHELDEKEIESWMKLIRVLMHEIMNSITPITSLSESLSLLFTRNGVQVSPSDLGENAIKTTVQGLNVIKEQGKGLMSFVDSYRKLTRLPDPDKKIFRVSDLIARVTLLYDSLENSSKVALSYRLIDPDMEIHADQNMISQVLLNLLRNALEANEFNQSGRIEIVAGMSPDDRPEICVIDNGPGIAPENLEEIFVPFFTTRQNGSGIGLSISRQIMKLHGGSLRARSVPGEETVFCLAF